MLFKKKEIKTNIILKENKGATIKKENPYNLQEQERRNPPIKKINTKKVKDFYDASKIIKNYIKNKDWGKAQNAINEIRKKEEKSRNIFLSKIINEKEKNSKKKEFDKNILVINRLEKILKDKQSIEYKKINNSIEKSINTRKNIFSFLFKKTKESEKITPKNEKKKENESIIGIINTDEIDNNKLTPKNTQIETPLMDLDEKKKDEKVKENIAIENEVIDEKIKNQEESKKNEDLNKVKKKFSLINIFSFLFKKRKEEKGKNEKYLWNSFVEINTTDKQENTDNKNQLIVKEQIIEEKGKNENIWISKNQKNKEWEKNNKEKKFDSSKVKDFNDAINAIKIYIFTEDWEKAHKAVEEIREKEKNALDIFIKTLDDDSKKKISEKKRFERNAFIISKIEVTLREKEQKYNDKISWEKFKIKFKKIKDEITLLTKTNKAQDAFTLLSNFMEDNKDKYVVIKFYNNQKKIIHKAIEKERAKEEIRIKKNTRNEAMKLIWQTIKWENEENSNFNDDNDNNRKKEKKKKSLISIFNFYKIILEKRRRRKLIDEVTSLIESQNQAEMDIAKSKLEKVHQWLIKELSITNIKGYEFYWKILGADKISWDTFGFIEDKNKYNFFLWDATGHWVKAGLIVSLLSRLFSRYSIWYEFKKMLYEINNWLKQDLQSRSFITWIFFEIEKEKQNTIKYIGMWHEPMFVHRAIEQKTEKIVAGWLAAWIRIIEDEQNIKVRNVELGNNDILICFSDGIVEARNIDWELYWLKRIEECINKNSSELNITKLYNAIIDDVKIFKWGSKFEDDATIIILKRNEQKDIIKEKDNYLQEMILKEGLSKNVVKKMIGKTKEEMEEELEKIRQDKKIKNIVKVLEWYYYTGETLTLKQEAIRFIKEWFIHPQINKYLKLAIANEGKYKIEQKNKKIESKYNVLKILMKKWDYLTVIKECNEIIAKDGNI